MKKFYILALMLLASVSALAQNGRTLYNKYSDLPDVEAVYISPAMFRLIGKIPDVELQDGSVNFGPIIKSLSGLYILNIPKSEAAAQLADEVNRFVTKGHYELLMEAKDNGEVMRMYTAGDDKIVNRAGGPHRRRGEGLKPSIGWPCIPAGGGRLKVGVSALGHVGRT